VRSSPRKRPALRPRPHARGRYASTDAVAARTHSYVTAFRYDGVPVKSAGVSVLEWRVAGQGLLAPGPGGVGGVSAQRAVRLICAGWLPHMTVVRRKRSANPRASVAPSRRCGNRAAHSWIAGRSSRCLPDARRPPVARRRVGRGPGWCAPGGGGARSSTVPGPCRASS
jgi:hypothetical protein